MSYLVVFFWLQLKNYWELLIMFHHFTRLSTSKQQATFGGSAQRTVFNHVLFRATNCHSNGSRHKRTRSASPSPVSSSGKDRHVTTGWARSASCAYIGYKRASPTGPDFSSAAVRSEQYWTVRSSQVRDNPYSICYKVLCALLPNTAIFDVLLYLSVVLLWFRLVVCCYSWRYQWHDWEGDERP